jgi:hypothetical protein
MTTTDLVTEMTSRCDQVIELELARLGRRQPRLTAAELAVVEQVLAEVADKLLLDALRRKPTLLGRVEPLFTT